MGRLYRAPIAAHIELMLPHRGEAPIWGALPPEVPYPLVSNKSAPKQVRISDSSCCAIASLSP